VKLVTRIQLTDDEELLMNLTGELLEKLDGYESGREHPEPEEVSAFLRNNGFPWKQTFISVFIYDDNEDPDPSGASIKAYGHPFLYCETAQCFVT
jgi:hypothetical protein